MRGVHSGHGLFDESGTISIDSKAFMHIWMSYCLV